MPDAMTTMASKDGVFAIDSQSTRGNVNISSNTKKAFVIEASGFMIESDGEGGDLATEDQRRIGALNGWLFAGAGHYGQVMRMARWLNSQDGEFKADEHESYAEAPIMSEMVGLLLAPDVNAPVIVFDYGEVMVDNFDGDHFAIGTGQDFALAAMDAGSSAHQAVGIAAGRDMSTGFPIRGYEIIDGAWNELEQINSLSDLEPDPDV